MILEFLCPTCSFAYYFKVLIKRRIEMLEYAVLRNNIHLNNSFEDSVSTSQEHADSLSRVKSVNDNLTLVMFMEMFNVCSEN
jgi:hypothetical protein